MSADDQRLLYERLVRTHWKELYIYALRLSGNRADAEDVVQQAYLQAWRSIDSLRDPHAARSWLYTIARRACWRVAEARNSVGKCPIPVDVVDHSDHHRTIDEQDTVQKALNALDRTFREPFLMVVMEGLSCRKTADELGIPLGTVLSRIARAREKLKCILAADGIRPGAAPGSRSEDRRESRGER